MPTIRVYNPRRKRRQNPGASELFIVGNPKPMAKHKRSRRRMLAVNRHRNPVIRHRSRARRHRRRNPLDLKDNAALALWASVGGVGTRMAVQTFMPNQNSGVTGYAANAATAVVLGWIGDKFISPRAGQGLLIGGLAGTVMRIASDTILKSNPQAQSAAAMSGLAGDREFALGDFQSSYFFEPSVNTGPNQVVVPPPFAAYLPPAVPAAKSSGLHGYDSGYMGGVGTIVPDRFASRWS